MCYLSPSLPLNEESFCTRIKTRITLHFLKCIQNVTDQIQIGLQAGNFFIQIFPAKYLLRLSDPTQIFVKIVSVFLAVFLFLNCGESEQSKVVFDFISCTQRSHLTLSRSLSLKWYSIKSLNYCNQTLLHIDWICTFLWCKRTNKLCACCTKKQTHLWLCVSRQSQLIAIQQIYVAVSYCFCCVVSTDALSLFWVLLQFVCVCTSVFARTCMTCCCWTILCVRVCVPSLGALWNNSYL